jgi:hypothetical protein
MKLPLTVAALAVSDRTCFGVLGVPWRTLRDWCEANAVPIARIGRRPVVRVAHLFEALDGATGAKPRLVLTDDDVVALAARGAR